MVLLAEKNGDLHTFKKANPEQSQIKRDSLLIIQA
jgi:hypothetical protein